jgi:hypothetical protein
MSTKNYDPNRIGVWFGRNIFRLLSFAAAGAVIWLVIKPLTPKFMEHANKNIADLIPLTDFQIEVFAAPQGTATNLVSTGQSTNAATMNIEQMKPISKQRSQSASQRVWAYGLQLTAFVAVLGTALWAIVALCRSDA